MVNDRPRVEASQQGTKGRVAGPNASEVTAHHKPDGAREPWQSVPVVDWFKMYAYRPRV